MPSASLRDSVFIFAAATFRPAFSKREEISPTTFLATASGLMIERVRSSAMGFSPVRRAAGRCDPKGNSEKPPYGSGFSRFGGGRFKRNGGRDPTGFGAGCWRGSPHRTRNKRHLYHDTPGQGRRGECMSRYLTI